MNKGRSLISIISAMIAFAMIGCVAKPPQALTLDQMHDDFDYVIKVIDEVYPSEAVSRKIYGIDIKETLVQYRARITGQETPQEFYQIVSEALYACKGNHLWVTPILASIRTRFLFWSWYPKDFYLNGIDDEAIDITWAYARAANSGLRSKPGIPLYYHKGDYYSKYPFTIGGQSYPQGMKLLSINGRKPQDILEELQDRLDCFDYEKKQFYGSMFHPRVGDDFYMLLGDIGLDFDFEDAANQRRKISLGVQEDVDSHMPENPLLAATPGVEMMENSGFLYIRLPAMDKASQDTILKALKKIKNPGSIKAVLLDVRNNKGGNDGVWISILSRITGHDISLAGKLAYRNTELSGKYLADGNRIQTQSERVPFLGQNFLIHSYKATILTSPPPKYPKVPIFLITQDVYSSTGGLLASAEINRSILRVGIENPTSLGRAGTPWFFALPNSQIIFSMRPSLDITGCRNIQDTLHCGVDIGINQDLAAMLDYFNASKGEETLEESMRQHDPFFIAISKYMRENKLPDDKTKST